MIRCRLSVCTHIFSPAVNLMNLVFTSVCWKSVAEKYLILHFKFASFFTAKWQYCTVQYDSDYGWSSCCASG